MHSITLREEQYLLGILRDHPNITLNKLVSLTGYSEKSITKHLQQLVHNNLVTVSIPNQSMGEPEFLKVLFNLTGAGRHRLSRLEALK